MLGRKRTHVVPGEFGHLRAYEAEVVRERLSDELNVLSRRRVALVAGRVVALAGRGPASLGGTRPGRSRRRRLGGVEQLLQRPTDVDDGQASVEHHAERKHLPQPRPRIVG